MSGETTEEQVITAARAKTAVSILWYGQLSSLILVPVVMYFVLGNVEMGRTFPEYSMQALVGGLLAGLPTLFYWKYFRGYLRAERNAEPVEYWTSYKVKMMPGVGLAQLPFMVAIGVFMLCTYEQGYIILCVYSFLLLFLFKPR